MFVRVRREGVGEWSQHERIELRDGEELVPDYEPHDQPHPQKPDPAGTDAEPARFVRVRQPGVGEWSQHERVPLTDEQELVEDVEPHDAPLPQKPEPPITEPEPQAEPAPENADAAATDDGGDTTDTPDKE